MEADPKPPEPELLPSGPSSAGRLYVRLLGGFSLELGGRAVPDTAFARRKPKSLLKLLALQGEHRLHREQVIEALWPGLPPPGGAAQLYKAVYQARRALLTAGSGVAPEAVLVVRSEELRLEAPGGVGTDVESFQALARRALGSRERGELERALAAYEGELLPTDLYEEWTLEPRETLREQAAALALALGEVRLEALELGDAAEAFRRALELDPLREGAHQGLLRVHARQGDRAGLERHYRRYAEALARALDAPPAPETARLYRALLEALPPAPPAAGRTAPGPAGPPRHNLPAQPSPFIGRALELAAIAERLADPECRLLTLVGPGGVGKTRLGLQAAAERLEDFEGGVYFVPLAQLAGPGSLLGAISEALRVSLYPGADPKAQLLERLKGPGVLLLLDNFEHLLEGAGLVAELLEAAPRLKLLVTSRSPLSLRSEWLLEVGGLDYPAGLEAAEAYSAVRLFVRELRRVRPGFAPGPEDLAAVVRICRLVEGFPLSLELAAARGHLLSCAEIADEIERGLGVLEAALRDLPLRHRSQRAAFEPSWQSLSPHEQQVFARLSVFRGGFRREAAEAVTGASLAVLSGLVEKSLLRRAPDGRYALHELLRQFAEEKLAARRERLEAARDRHARYYCQHLARQEARLKGPEHQAALGEVAGEVENLRAAWRWAAARGDLEALGASLGAVWFFGASRGSRMWEEEALFGEVIAALERQGVPASDPTLGRLKTARAAVGYRLGLYQRSQAALEEAIAAFRAAGSQGELAFALHHLAVVMHLLGDYGRERALLRESIALSRAVDDPWLTAYSLNDLGMATHLLGDDPWAERLCTRSLRLFEQLGEARGQAYALGNLGVVTLALGRPQEAGQLHRAALALSRENADRWAVAQGLLHLSDAGTAEGQHEQARQLALEALRLAADERIPAVALGALTRLAGLAGAGQREQARGWLALVLAHPSTSREDWARAWRLRAGLSSAPDRLPVHEAARWLEAVTAEVLGRHG